MELLHAEFIRERQYLKDVSTNTVHAYRGAWKAFSPALSGHTAVSKADLIRRIAEMKDAGLCAVTINTYVRSVNAFLRWLHEEGHSANLLRIPRLKEDSKVLQTLPQRYRR